MCKYFSDTLCSLDAAQEIINMYQYKDGSRQLRYAITNKMDGSFIGTCGFHFYDASNKRVEIGYDIWKDYWRKGYAREATMPLMNVCFEKLKVECVYALTHIDNEASGQLLLSLGFSLDGILRNWICVNGEQQNQKCFTITKNDWSEQRWK